MLAVLWTASIQTSSAQNTDLFSPLFASDEVLELTLTFDKQALLDDRGKESVYHPARISVADGTTSIDIPLRIKTRGNFRRKAENCIFPPLRLNFAKKSVKKNIFVGQNKLKLVTHCAEDQHIVKEYLIYKMYNLMTDHSFRVRLAKITFVDQLGNHEPETRFAFFIEAPDDMAARSGASIVNERVQPKELPRQRLLDLCTFHYITGNRDWDIYMQKNTKIMRLKESDILIPVPYDFDFSQIVSAPYVMAILNPAETGFKMRSFRHVCAQRHELSPCFKHFEESKDQLYDLFQNCEHLSAIEKNRIIRLLDKYYKVTQNERLIKKEFLKRCN